MSTEVRLPQWGMGMTEGTVLAWSKQEGETIEAGEDLVEIEAAKVTNVIEAPVTGTLARICVQEDETVACGTLLAIIDEPG